MNTARFGSEHKALREELKEMGWHVNVILSLQFEPCFYIDALLKDVMDQVQAYMFMNGCEKLESNDAKIIQEEHLRKYGTYRQYYRSKTK